MRKPDEAHILTDRKLEELEKRIASEYKKAADELTDKINAYFESFKKRDAKQKKGRLLLHEIMAKHGILDAMAREPYIDQPFSIHTPKLYMEV